MASQPLAAVIAVALPRQNSMELAVSLYKGLLPLAEQFDVALAGGDTNTWDAPLAISITLLGKPTGRGPLQRSGAKPGDRILVTGSFGGSILGRHFDFEPRVAEALTLHKSYELHAGADISDGLSVDLSHIAEESGCGAVIIADATPIADDARRLAAKTERWFDSIGSCPERRRGFRVGFGHTTRGGKTPSGRTTVERSLD